jgi:hypothetical protein
MDKIRGRLNDMIRLGTGDWIGIHDLDEILFGFPEILDYRATVIERPVGLRLKLEALPKLGCMLPDRESLESALRTAPQLRNALIGGYLELEPIRPVNDLPILSGAEKRTIIRVRES